MSLLLAHVISLFRSPAAAAAALEFWYVRRKSIAVLEPVVTFPFRPSPSSSSCRLRRILQRLTFPLATALLTVPSHATADGLAARNASHNPLLNQTTSSSAAVAHQLQPVLVFSDPSVEPSELVLPSATTKQAVKLPKTILLSEGVVVVATAA